MYLLSRHPKANNIFDEVSNIFRAKLTYRPGVTLTPYELINQIHYYQKYSELHNLQYNSVFEGTYICIIYIVYNIICIIYTYSV